MSPTMPSLAATLRKSSASASKLSLSFVYSLLICGLLASYQPFLSRFHRVNYGNDTATTRQREPRRNTGDTSIFRGRFVQPYYSAYILIIHNFPFPTKAFRNSDSTGTLLANYVALLHFIVDKVSSACLSILWDVITYNYRVIIRIIQCRNHTKN